MDMGRGDKKSRKGKINRGSYGKTRRPEGRKQKERLVPLPTLKPKPASQPAPAPAPEQPTADAAKS